MNEKSAASGQNRRDRFEVLLAEMKSDLDILKARLKEELTELGIDQTKARELLSEYYKTEECDLETHGEKRQAEIDTGKSSRRKLELDESLQQ